MTDTPETDTRYNPENGWTGVVPIDYARKLERERDAAIAERNEAREQLASAKREAEYLATIIHKSEYADVAPNWDLCDSVTGIISQINNMYAGVRQQRDELRRTIEAMHADQLQPELDRPFATAVTASAYNISANV